VDVKDQEDWAKIDANFAMEGGSLTGMDFGVRYSKHSRDSLNAIGQGPLFAGASDPASYPVGNQNYPSDFNQFGGSFPTDFWYWTPVAAQ
jgi:iron complex outermembrane receptor protein